MFIHYSNCRLRDSVWSLRRSAGTSPWPPWWRRSVIWWGTGPCTSPLTSTALTPPSPRGQVCLVILLDTRIFPIWFIIEKNYDSGYVGLLSLTSVFVIGKLFVCKRFSERGWVLFFIWTLKMLICWLFWQGSRRSGDWPVFRDWRSSGDVGG